MENKERLLSFVERIERLEEEKKELTADISEVLKEAKGEGFDTKVIKEIIKLRRMLATDRAEYEYLRDEYKKILGIE